MCDDCESLPFAETRVCRHRPHADAAVPSREEPQTACARLADATGEVGAGFGSSRGALCLATFKGSSAACGDMRKSYGVMSNCRKFQAKAVEDSASSHRLCKHMQTKAPEAPVQSFPEQTEDGLATNEVPGLKADEADRSIQADPIEPGLGSAKEEISLPPDAPTVHETSIEPVAPSTKQQQQKPQKLKTQQTSKPKENADKGSKPKTDVDKASKPKADVVDKAAKPTLSEGSLTIVGYSWCMLVQPVNPFTRRGI